MLRYARALNKVDDATLQSCSAVVVVVGFHIHGPGLVRLIVSPHNDGVEQEGAQHMGPDVDERRQVHPDVPPHLVPQRAGRGNRINRFGERVRGRRA